MDATNQLLMAIAMHLSNSTSLLSINPPAEFSPSPSAVRVNCFWFLSITISLTAGVIGILCKQWIREFQRDAALPANDSLALRQFRYIGWERWAVPQLISLPAILLQGSLLLFLTGLIDALWFKIGNHKVALCASVIISIAGSLMAMTTVLPAFYYLRRPLYGEQGISYPCPYKSPQAYAFLRFCHAISSILTQVLRLHHLDYSFSLIIQPSGWLAFERQQLKESVKACGGFSSKYSFLSMDRYRSLALRWIEETLAFNAMIRNSLFHCLQDSRRTCDNNKDHVFFEETEEDCQVARPPEGSLAHFMAEDATFSFELLTRLRLNASPESKVTESLPELWGSMGIINRKWPQQCSSRYPHPILNFSWIITRSSPTG
jgi:hypothetical protein